MLDRPRIVKEGKEAEEEEDDDEDEEDEELPSYLREQSSDEEHAALYSKNKLNANGESSLHLYSTLLCFPLLYLLYSTLLYSLMLFRDLSYRALHCTLFLSPLLSSDLSVILFSQLLCYFSTSSQPLTFIMIKSNHMTGKKAKDRKNDVTGFRANTWLPSEARSVNTQRAAVEQRDSDRAQRDAVLDGSRAPKLTGRNRQMKVRYAATIYCPSMLY